MQAIRKSAASQVFGEIQKLAVEFGLAEDIGQGKFICPITREAVSWETLGRMHIDGDDITLYSIHANHLTPKNSEGSIIEFKTVS